MMKRSSLAFASALAASLLIACMSPVIGEKTATIVIATAPAPGSRALTETWPMGGLPVFSDITVSVLDAKGNEMLLPREPVVSGNSITVTVTAGKDMTLVVDAAPDWDATASAYSGYEEGFPTLVTMFSGRKKFSVNAGDTTTVTIALATSGTKILLPNPNGNWQIGVADSFTTPTITSTNFLTGLTSRTSYIDYDQYGNLFISTEVGIESYRNITTPYSPYFSDIEIMDIVMSEASNRLYGLLEIEGFSLEFIDFDDIEPMVSYVVSNSDYSFLGYGVAADGQGRVLVPAYEYATGRHGIVRLNIGDSDGESAEAYPSGFISLESIGLQYTVYVGEDTSIERLQIEDMTVVNDVLYILGSQVTIDSLSGQSATDVHSRGKIVAVDTGTLKKLWETGWNSSKNFPSSRNDSTIFAGPRRFVAMAPKRLYVLDDGFAWFDDGLAERVYVDDVNRVTEIDLTRGSILSSAIFTGQYSLDYLYTYSGGYLASDLFPID